MGFKVNLGRHKSNQNLSQINHRMSSEKHSENFWFKNWLCHHMSFQIFSIFFTLIMMFLLAMYFITPLNKIQRISIKGNNTIARDRIVKNLRIKPGNSLSRFYFHRYRYRKQLMNNNVKLRKIRIHFHRWNHISICLSEYRTLAYLKRGNGYYIIIKNGRIANRVSNLKNNRPILVSFSKMDDFKAFIEGYNQIPGEIKADINHIVFTPTSIDPNRIHVFMNDGNQIYANFKTWETKMKYYSVISKLMKKKGIVNFEVGAYSYHKRENGSK